MYLQKNLHEIADNISRAAKRSGQDEKDITLIAVTKTVNEDYINQAIELGVKNIGENKIQEIQRKYDNIKKGVSWHMIGHLQSNKVKFIIDKVDLIHSLDRMSLAEEIQRRAELHDKVLNCLIQVNISEEETKFGIKKENVIPFIESILEFKNIRIKGLMTMAPFVNDPNEVRYVFKGLKDLSQMISNRNYKDVEMKYLSMGMTNDYEVAIEEGANMIRIGTGIFGRRNY